jgi:hypothetical protein
MNPQTLSASPPPLALSRWRRAPAMLMVAGGALALLGFFLDARQFAFSWLLAFMFCLSLCLGALFLVIMHHLFDAGWSVPIRRFNEHIASLLFPWMALLFVPIALPPVARTLYPWLSPQEQAHPDQSLHAKFPLFTVPGFYVVAAACFLIWWLLSHGLRRWSLKQDETGDARCTFKMRSCSCWGIFAFAVTLTTAAIMWMKALQQEWFSTMYGVIYFAGSAWVALATAYVITMVLDRQKVLSDVLHEHQYYFIGSLLFAFTVFYAYVHFGQYFIIWNGNIPEETFWYVIRERGTWWWVGIIIIFGHFFIPFLALLRIDVKSLFPYMTALCAWAWLMQYVDLSFNIMPVAHPEGYPLRWIWLDWSCMAFMVGLLAEVFLARLAAAPPYPIKDPRLIEAMGHYHVAPAPITGFKPGPGDDLPDASSHGSAK